MYLDYSVAYWWWLVTSLNNSMTRIHLQYHWTVACLVLNWQFTSLCLVYEILATWRGRLWLDVIMFYYVKFRWSYQRIDDRIFADWYRWAWGIHEKTWLEFLMMSSMFWISLSDEWRRISTPKYQIGWWNLRTVRTLSVPSYRENIPFCNKTPSQQAYQSKSMKYYT